MTVSWRRDDAKVIVGGVEAKNFVLHLGTTDERSQWCNRLPTRKGGSTLGRIISLKYILWFAAAAIVIAMTALSAVPRSGNSAVNCKTDPETNELFCAGGAGYGGGGSGGIFKGTKEEYKQDGKAGFASGGAGSGGHVEQGGFGTHASGGGGGGGHHCGPQSGCVGGGGHSPVVDPCVTDPTLPECGGPAPKAG